MDFNRLEWIVSAIKTIEECPEARKFLFRVIHIAGFVALIHAIRWW